MSRLADISQSARYSGQKLVCPLRVHNRQEHYHWTTFCQALLDIQKNADHFIPVILAIAGNASMNFIPNKKCVTQTNVLIFLFDIQLKEIRNDEKSEW